MNNYDNRKPQRVKSPRPILSEVFSWIRVVISAVAIALFLSFFVIANTSIESGSMENTIMTGDRVMCNRLAYNFSDPERYDIVLFEYPYGEESVNYVKRVIGLPGETVNIIEGKVYINNSTTPLDDSFVCETPFGDFGPFVVPEGQYFMLGDNRNNSFDSKSWDTPYISREKLIGKAMFAYFPHFVIFPDIK